LVVPDRNDQDALSYALVGPAKDWQGGFNLGNLGMPLIQDPLKAALDIAPFFNAWVVPIEQTDLWRMDRRAQRHQEDPGRLALLVDAATKREPLPLIMSNNGGAGFISDTLTTIDAHNLGTKRGGVRLINTLADGSTLRSLPPMLALSIDQPHLSAVVADDKTLQFMAVPMGAPAQPIIQLQWQQLSEAITDVPVVTRPEDAEGLTWDNPGASPPWGLSASNVLYEQWKQDEAASTEVLSRLLWLPLPHLLALPFDADDLRRLLEADDPVAHRLLRRLTASEAGVINEWISLIGPDAAAIRRDIILRLLADERMHHVPLLGQLIHESNDPEILRSVLRTHDMKPSMALLRILIQRLRMQAKEEISMDDESLQHALAHAVFDSPYLSPTPLRELAVGLREKVPALAKPPIERFLALNGEKRSAK
jgi:hypothetical protein